MTDRWDPARYHRFRGERAAPFRDLLALVEPVAGGRVVDLGCGTGELTGELHATALAGETLGLDTSAAMLAEAPSAPGLRFEQAAIEDYAERAERDIVFSNAALHWVDDHPALFARLRDALRPGGQLAVQIPANFDHVSHVVAAEVAGEGPFADALGGYARRPPVLAPEAYAELLEELGFAEQHVRLQVYPHRLDGPESVVDWVRGTLLTDYLGRLPEDLQDAFVVRYREVLLGRLPRRRPYFYAFKRILLRAALAA